MSMMSFFFFFKLKVNIKMINQIFKSYSEFQKRKDKKINGFSSIELLSLNKNINCTGC